MVETRAMWQQSAMDWVESFRLYMYIVTTIVGYGMIHWDILTIMIILSLRVYDSLPLGMTFFVDAEFRRTSTCPTGHGSWYNLVVYINILPQKCWENTEKATKKWRMEMHQTCIFFSDTRILTFGKFGSDGVFSPSLFFPQPHAAIL